MLFANHKTETQTFEEIGDETLVSTAVQSELGLETPLPTDADLFALYEKIAETRPGTRDAQIFSKIREWTFSDFSLQAHEFAGITTTELTAWQKRHSINLSSGHIRPDHIDLLRGHHWGQIRRDDHVNGRHTQYGPPSREELIEMMGPAR